MKDLDNTKRLLFLGDIHGDWRELFFNITTHSISNAYIISVGDIGVGFQAKKDDELEMYQNINKEFKQNNIIFYGIRGNHDDPFYFQGDARLQLSNFELLEDYSLFKYGVKTIQLIGGAVSIDRTGRTLNVSYWENEGVVYKKDLCREVDVLVTHTAPSYCYPQRFNEMVYSWAREDAYLIEDLTDERAVTDEIFKLCKPKQHFYGHFHTSRTEQINDCVHKLLNIDELYECR